MQAIISQEEWEEYRDLKTRFNAKLKEMDQENLKRIVDILKSLRNSKKTSFINVDDVLEWFIANWTN